MKESDMNVGQLCQRKVVTVEPGDELVTAARLMREKHVGFLIVVEPAEHEGHVVPVGVITDRDIVVATIALDVDPKTLRVDDVMTRKPTLALAEDSITDALCQMRRAGVRRLPVVGDYGHLVGVLSLDDILTKRAEELEAAADVLVKGRQIESVMRR
jgi:CBS domain-containing protein